MIWVNQGHVLFLNGEAADAQLKEYLNLRTES